MMHHQRLKWYLTLAAMFLAHGPQVVLAEASHDTGGATGDNPLPVDPDLAIFTAIVFLLLMIILGKFAWRPIMDALDERERGVADQIAAAQRSNEDAQRLLAEHQRKLAAAADEVRGLLDRARQDAETQKTAIVDEAREAAKSEKDRAIREIVAARNDALRDLADRSVGTAVELAGQIVGRQLNQEDHAQLIQDALKQFPSKN